MFFTTHGYIVWINVNSTSTVAGVGFVSRKLCGLLPAALRTQVSSKGKKDIPNTRGGETGFGCVLLSFYRSTFSALRR